MNNNMKILSLGFFSADYKVVGNATLYMNLSRIDGDQVLTATPAPGFLKVASAVGNDAVFSVAPTAWERLPTSWRLGSVFR